MKERLKAPELRFPGFTDDWEERKLGDEVTFFSGLTYSPDNIVESGSTLVLRSSNVKNGEIVDADNVYVENEAVNSDNVQVGDVIVVVRNGSRNLIGKHAQIKKEMDDTVIGAFMTGERSDTPYFINALLDTEQFTREIYKNLGATINQITTGAFKKMQFVVPKNKTEKEQIGNFFKQIDDTIALHQRKLDLLKEQKKGYLQKMFPKNGAKVPELRFAGFADDWEERKLIDVKDNEDRYSYTGGPFGSDLKYSDYTEIGVRIIQLQNIGDGKFVNDYKIYTSEEKARSLNSNLIYPGEIIIAKMADPLARATILPKIEPKYLMASDGIRLKISTDYFDNYYILTLINSDVFRKEALNNSTGTTRKRIGLVTLGNLPMMIPSFEEQQKIGSFFKQLDETIALHQRKLDLLKEQKKGFLQKMFV